MNKPFQSEGEKRDAHSDGSHLRHWLGKRVLIRPGAPQGVVGSFGEVVATQWTPFGWRLAVKLANRGAELLVTESQLRHEPESPKQSEVGHE